MHLALSLCLMSAVALPACPLLQDTEEPPQLLAAPPPPPPPEGWYALQDAENKLLSSRRNWHDWFMHVYPVNTELRWQHYGWTQQFGLGVQKAAQERKPLVLWLGNGHPLGATSPTGLAMRDVWVSASVTPLMDKLFPVADDLARLQRSTDAEAEFLRSVLAQEERTAGWSDGGVVVLSPSGILLASCSQAAAQEDLAATLQQGLDAWQDLDTATRIAVEDSNLEAPNRIENSFPHDGLALEVFLRDMPTTEGEIPVVSEVPRQEMWSRDYLWFSREEMMAIRPPDSLRSREGHEIPAPLASRLARFALHDRLYGPGTPYSESDVATATITLRTSASTKTHRHFMIQGEVVLVHENADPPYGIKVQLWGRAQWERKGEHFSLMEILGEGTRLGNEPHSGRAQENEGIAPRPLGFALRRVLARDGWHQVPPSTFSQYPEGWSVGTKEATEAH